MSLTLSETLEAPLLRVPFESLKRAAKDRKALIDELSDHLASLKHPQQSRPSEPKGPGSSSQPPADPSGDTEMEDAAAGEGVSGREASIERLRLLLSQLQGVKRKLGEVSRTEADDCARCKARLDYLAATAPTAAAAAAAAGGTPATAAAVRDASADSGAASPAPPGAGGGAAAAGAAGPGPGSAAAAAAAAAAGGGAAGGGGGLISWTRQRLDVILVDHLLRSGYHDSAAKLAAAAGIQLLTDGHIFEGARRVLAALLEDHDCGPALAWCADNRSRLAKSKSGLEFKLRLQQFIELVRAGPAQRAAAIAHARAHLAPWVTGTAATAPQQQQQHLLELQRAVATLAFPAAARERVPAYRALFQESAWHGLADLFMRDLYRLHSLTPESLLTVYLQAGLSALKTPASGAPGGSRDDPLRLPPFQRLAAHLPLAKHMHSKLVCAVTKELMSDANPPLLLPNGLVYSTRGIELLLAQGVPGGGSSSGGGGGGGSSAQEERGRTPTPPGGLGGGSRTPAPEGRGAGGGGGGGAVGVCPMTGQVFRRDELRRLYIA